MMEMPAVAEEPKLTSINVRLARRIVDGKETVVYSADVGYGMQQADYTDVDKFCGDLTETIKAAAKDL
jgi:hypothetical protein